MHASDSGFQRYVNEWEGHDGEFLPFNHEAVRAPTTSSTPTTA